MVKLINKQIKWNYSKLVSFVIRNQVRITIQIIRHQSLFLNNIFHFFLNYLLREEVLLSYYRLNIMQLNVSDSIMPDSEHEQDLKYTGKSVWRSIESDRWKTIESWRSR